MGTIPKHLFLATIKLLAEYKLKPTNNPLSSYQSAITGPSLDYRMGIRLISHPNNPKHKATQPETKNLEWGRRGEGRKESGLTLSSGWKQGCMIPFISR